VHGNLFFKRCLFRSFAILNRNSKVVKSWIVHTYALQYTNFNTECALCIHGALNREPFFWFMKYEIIFMCFKYWTLCTLWISLDMLWEMLCFWQMCIVQNVFVCSTEWLSWHYCFYLSNKILRRTWISTKSFTVC